MHITYNMRHITRLVMMLCLAGIYSTLSANVIVACSSAGFQIHRFGFVFFCPYASNRIAKYNWEPGNIKSKLHAVLSDCRLVCNPGRIHNYSIRAVPEIILGGGPARPFCVLWGGCFGDNVSEGWGGVTCPGGQGVFDP